MINRRRARQHFSNAPALRRRRPHPAIYLDALAYGVMLVLLVRPHEPWADEAQSRLLARDTSLVNLWGKLLHYEGTPGLWQTLLHLLIRIGLDY